MKYAISIDWLAFYVKFDAGAFVPMADPNGKVLGLWSWGYKKCEYGTRQFAELWQVSFNGELIAEVQTRPHSGILAGECGIIKFENRLLYTPNLWDIVEQFLTEHFIHILNISRIDICADFNAFKDYECRQFIDDFLNSRNRHKGKGIGAAYFNHYSHREHKCSVAVVKYTGLTFGSRNSGVRVYLYNKSFELLTVKNKPYMRELWKQPGLDTTQDVWRLEVSITADGKKFKDANTGDIHEITPDSVKNAPELVKLFHTYVRKYFSFIKNRPGITNISREPIITLFDYYDFYTHRAANNQSCSNRTERILIKQLWQLAQTYRGYDLHSDEGLTKSLADSVAKSCGLEQWLREKRLKWEKPNFK